MKNDVFKIEKINQESEVRDEEYYYEDDYYSDEESSPPRAKEEPIYKVE